MANQAFWWAFLIGRFVMFSQALHYQDLRPNAWLWRAARHMMHHDALLKKPAKGFGRSNMKNKPKATPDVIIEWSPEMRRLIKYVKEQA